MLLCCYGSINIAILDSTHYSTVAYSLCNHSFALVHSTLEYSTAQDHDRSDPPSTPPPKKKKISLHPRKLHQPTLSISTQSIH